MDVLKVDLVGVGLNAADTVVPVREFPARGSKTEYRGGSLLAGGQVASTVVACQSWGMATRYVGKLGEDDAARLHAEAFLRAGVETRIVTVAGGTSAQSTILVDAQGERTVLCRKDERMVLRPEELERTWIEQARVLHVDGHDTAAATLAARWARAAGVAVVADLDELYPGVEELMGCVDYLIVNHDFACRLMRDPDLPGALRAMHARYGCRLSAATLGEDGVLAWDGEQFYATAAFKVDVVDSTGAGDIFRAGFICGMLRGWELRRQMEFACAAAALNCMSVGARGGIGTVEQIEELVRTGERYAVRGSLGEA